MNCKSTADKPHSALPGITHDRVNWECAPYSPPIPIRSIESKASRVFRPKIQPGRMGVREDALLCALLKFVALSPSLHPGGTWGGRSFRRSISASTEDEKCTLLNCSGSWMCYYCRGERKGSVWLFRNKKGTVTTCIADGGAMTSRIPPTLPSGSIYSVLGRLLARNKGNGVLEVSLTFDFIGWFIQNINIYLSIYVLRNYILLRLSNILPYTIFEDITRTASVAWNMQFSRKRIALDTIEPSKSAHLHRTSAVDNDDDDDDAVIDFIKK